MPRIRHDMKKKVEYLIIMCYNSVKRIPKVLEILGRTAKACSLLVLPDIGDAVKQQSVSLLEAGKSLSTKR